MLTGHSLDPISHSRQASYTSPPNAQPLTPRPITRIQHTHHQWFLGLLFTHPVWIPTHCALPSLIPWQICRKYTTIAAALGILRSSIQRNTLSKARRRRRNQIGVVPTLPPAIVFRVQGPDVFWSRIAIFWQVERGLAQVVRIPGLGLGDSHQLGKDGVAGGIGEDCRWWMSAEGHVADVDAHCFDDRVVELGGGKTSMDFA